MDVPRTPHRWSVSPREAVRIQRRLTRQVVRQGRLGRVRQVAGADVAFSRDGLFCIAGVVVWDVRREEVIETRTARTPLRFPYVPGLLSFREVPALLAALRKLSSTPDVFMFDGQGTAHPRRFGLACHVGVILDRPSIGCAKSVLVGTYDPPDPNAGSVSALRDGTDRVGTVLRTRTGVKPVFVSVGHRIGLAQAVRIVRSTTTRYRLPEPTRQADKLVARVKRAGP